MDKKKLSYANNMLFAFENIDNNFNKMRNIGKLILYILVQKNNLEKEYAEGINLLYNLYYNNIKNNSHKNTLDTAIDYLLNELKNESNFHLNNINNIEEKILKPFEILLKKQFNKGMELKKQINSVQNNFKKIYDNLENIKLKFHSAANFAETTLTKFEKIKYYIEKENFEFNTPNSNNFNKFSKSENNLKIPLQMKKKLSEENEKKFKRYDDSRKKNIAFAKELETKYKEFIFEANKERENFISNLKNIYNSFEEMDENYIKEFQNYLINITQYQIEIFEKKLEMKKEEIKQYNLININSDIEFFIKENETIYSYPIEFKFEPYHSEIKCKKVKDEKAKEKYEIEKRVSSLMKDIFKYIPKEYSNNPDLEINFSKIEKNIKSIWNGLNYERDFLFSLFDKNIYRMHFLNSLNYYREQGLFFLEQNSFNSLCLILNFMLTKAEQDNDYECIKLCMILSQTFFLGKEKKELVQDVIQKNNIWKHRKIWEELIKYSINSEINNPNNYRNLFNENKETRDNRIHSSAYGNLITFWYNMKIFQLPMEKSKYVIRKFCNKYNINENEIYSFDIPENEIKENNIIFAIDNSIEKDNLKELSMDEKKNNNSI